jgi:hypothetical protein
LLSKAADGAGEAMLLVAAEAGAWNAGWSHDGRFFIYDHGDDTRKTGTDISYLERSAADVLSGPTVFVGTSAWESSPRLSPDSRYLAYVSTESGRDEIYVRPFPSGDGKWQASINGGRRPRWRNDGSELYFQDGDTLMSVSASTARGFTLGRPEVLFESPDLDSRFRTAPSYDVSADGTRFLTFAPVEGSKEEPLKIRIVQNWNEEFRDREQD